MNEWMERGFTGCTRGLMDGQMDRWIEGCSEGWIQG